MQKNGWIRLYKKTDENEIWRHDLKAWHVFEYVLLNANEHGQLRRGYRTISEYLEIPISTVHDSVKRLEKAGMLNASPNGIATTFNILNWKRYQAPTERFAGNKPETNRKQTEHIQEIRIENINTNTDVLVFGKPEINEIFEYWSDTTGIPITSQFRNNRNAASSLLKQHGAAKLKRLIDGVAMAQADKYAPRIANFVQLRAKLPDLLVWGKQQQSRTEII